MLPVGSACAVILAVALAAWSQSALHFGYAAGAGATVVCYSVSLLLAPKQLPYLRVGVQSPAGRVARALGSRSEACRVAWAWIARDERWLRRFHDGVRSILGQPRQGADPPSSWRLLLLQWATWGLLLTAPGRWWLRAAARRLTSAHTQR